MTNERTNSYYRDRRMDLLGIRGGLNMKWSFKSGINYTTTIDFDKQPTQELTELWRELGDYLIELNKRIAGMKK